MTAIKNPAPVGSGFIDSGSNDTMAANSPATTTYNRRILGRQKQTVPPPQPGPVIPRLKLTKPRQPRLTDQDVDWEEDLRPTPNETKGNEATAVSASGPSKRPSTTDNKSTANREMQPKETNPSAKRRKVNTRKSATARNNSDKRPQLPLITPNTGIASAALENRTSLGLGISNSKIRGSITEKIAGIREPSQPKPPQRKGTTANVKKGKQPNFIEIPSGTSVSSKNPSDLDDEDQGPIRATTSKVSIMEYRAHSQDQDSRGKAACRRPTATSSSDGDYLGSSRPSASKVTIFQARAQPKRQTRRTKATRDKNNSGRHGRAESVGSKLMIALQGAIAFSQAPLITDAKEFTVRPSAVPTRAAKTEEPFEEKSLHNSPVEEPAKMLAADLAKDDTKPAEKPEDQAKPDHAGAISIDKSYQHEPEITQQTDLTQLCESLSSTNGDSSDFEVGRGLVGDQPSILDYHMETEHLSGFAALQPIRSQHSTSTQATDRFPSQEDTSSGASDEETAAKIRKVTTESAQGREHTHTPESQKHLLTNEALMELDSSEKPPKSLPKTSIVDSNGSPRLIPKKTKNADVPQLDLEDDPVHREEIRVTDTSRSQYSRSSCDLSTEDTYDSVVWTKYQRDMFLEYGIDTDKLKQTRLDPRPMPVSRYPLSAFPKGTTDAIDADRASSSSQRTTRDKMNSTEPENPGPIDRGWGQETPTLPGPDKESQPSTAAHDSMEWITALQVAQNHAQDLLHETNSHLSTQLAAEKATITQVLEIYRKGCGQILDDIFKAQEARMHMYQQQMQYVKGQHAIICEDMVRGLQELDRRVQRGP